jgi:hypothetical protein
MGTRRPLPPPVKCSATNRQGRRCGRWAKPGATICYSHGAAAPQVMENADARRVLATVLATDPARAPWAVILDATRIADGLMVSTESAIRAGEAVKYRIRRRAFEVKP